MSVDPQNFVALEIVGPPVLGTAIGAYVGGKGHRLSGAGIGLVVGVGVTFVLVKAIAAYTASTTVLPWTTQVQTLQHGQDYRLSLPGGGGDAAATARAAGFTDATTNADGLTTGNWQGASGSAVPAGLVAKQ